MLQADGVAAFRGERLVFRDLSFAVSAGGALVLSGPNGSGKSTLLRLLAGLLPMAAGTVRWNGQDALTDLPLHAGRLVYVGHKDAVKPGLTVTENLKLAALIGGGSIAAALTAMGLAELADMPARMLSAGQQRRLALARLALGSAPLWLLDEPTLGLDARSVMLLADLVVSHRGRGGLVVAATHLALPVPDAATLRLG